MKTRHTRDGWTRVTEVPGWADHHLDVQVDVIGGRAAVTALRLTPAGPAKELTRERLARFPSATIAAHVASAATKPATLRSAAKPSAPRHDIRATTTVEQVVAVYSRAVADGLHNPRAVVVDTLGISPATAHRYLRRARAEGLLPGKDA